MLQLSGCCYCQQRHTSIKYCLLLNDLRQHLKAECLINVIDFSTNTQGEKKNPTCNKAAAAVQI